MRLFTELIEEGNRIKGNLYLSLRTHNQVVEDHKPNKEDKIAIRGSLNSYLGMMKHYKTYKYRKNTLYNKLSLKWHRFFNTNLGFEKIIIKKVPSTLILSII